MNFMFNKLFSQRNIPVNFLDCHGSTIDRSLFDQAQYRTIRQHGIKLSPINIIHYASVHYIGRFRNNVSMRFINSFIDIVSSIGISSDGGLYLLSDENNELQARSSEVLAVGICIGLSSKIFSINKNRIGLIDGPGKRCDFYFIKDNQQYYIESKGRKGSITTAIQDIFLKKANHDQHSPKYGIISQLPRSTERVNVTVVDPEFVPEEMSTNEQIRRLLVHYKKIAYLSGFWRLGELLTERHNAISDGIDYTELNEKALDYQNVLKMGIGIEVNIGGVRSEVFFPRGNRYGFRKQVGDLFSLFLMERELIEILERQDFKRLIEYELKEETIGTEDGAAFSVLNDGSLFSFMPVEQVEKYR